MKFWPFTLKIFSQPLDKIKLFFKQRKIIKIKFRSIWSILKAFTASRNLDIYKNNGLFRKAPLEGSDSNLWKGFTWLLLLFFSYVFKAPDLCFDMVLPRTYNYNLTNIWITHKRNLKYLLIYNMIFIVKCFNTLTSKSQLTPWKVRDVLRSQD